MIIDLVLHRLFVGGFNLVLIYFKLKMVFSLPSDDYKPLIKTFEDGTRIKQAQRSWEGEQFNVYRLRERDHKSSLFGNKFFRKGRKIVPAIPAEEWTIFPGDQVFFKFFFLFGVFKHFYIIF